MKWTAVTDVGKVRKQNEDYFLLPDKGGTRAKFNRYGILAVVCDGMGGALAGEVASEKAAVLMKKYFYELLEEKSSSRKSAAGETSESVNKAASKPAAEGEEQDPYSWIYSEQYLELLGDLMKEALRKANTDVWKLSMENEAYRGMGTTLTAAWVTSRFAVFVSVGDSRGYIYHHQSLSQITEDQSYVWDLYKQGAITKDQIRFHPMNHLMNLAVGVEEHIQDEQIGLWNASVEQGDIILLCSDGLSDILSDDSIEKNLQEQYDAELQQAAQSIVDEGNSVSGKDNMTVVLIRIEEQPG